MTNEPSNSKAVNEEHAWRRAVRILVIASAGIEGAWLVLFVLKLMHRH